MHRRAEEQERARIAYLQQQQQIAARQQYQEQVRRQQAQEEAARQDAINRQQAAGMLVDVFGQIAQNNQEREAREQAEREAQAQAAREQAEREQMRVQAARAEADRILAERGSNTVTFRIKSSHPNVVHVRFYSLDRDVAWPAADRVYVLDDSQVHNIVIQGQPGERICLGAWVEINASINWGAGQGKPADSSKYYPCDGRVTSIINLQ
jgi:multidrug efflux pump subunit AcrA (membrane-fusion protein)